MNADRLGFWADQLSAAGRGDEIKQNLKYGVPFW